MILAGSAVLLMLAPRADQPLIDAAEYFVPSLRAIYFTAGVFEPVAEVVVAPLGDVFGGRGLAEPAVQDLGADGIVPSLAAVADRVVHDVPEMP